MSRDQLTPAPVDAQREPQASALPQAPALPFGQVAMPSAVLVEYASEGWEIVARLRGAAALLEGDDKADDEDTIRCAMRLLRDAIARSERFALATLDRKPLPAGFA